MDTNQETLNKLLSQLETLLKKQDEFSKEIETLRTELNRLKAAETKPTTPAEQPEPPKPVAETQPPPPPPVQKPAPQPPAPWPPPKPSPKTSQLETFIGENLSNKIGIIITVIGVAIGAKYAIDHELISPLTRIILGYLAGIILLGFAIRLRPRYENFSAVLLSGAMAVFYFITYAAYSFYGLIPQLLAFGMMVLFTVFTVVAALSYNLQVIAHVGLVGAYAIPFLLSSDSGRVDILFSYTSIINLGILFISFQRNWKPISYSAFGITWLIYWSWFLMSYRTDTHFTIALTFLAVFFILFYLIVLSYKLLQQEKFRFDDILLLILNAFIFYGIGYAILDGHETGTHLLGLFTLGNAVVHFGAGLAIYQRRLADRNLFYFVSGLVLLFITLAIPVQLDGNWVTLLWAGEAALLFWVGRTKEAPVYERLAYPLIVIAFFSLLHDWGTVYNHYAHEWPESRLTPLLNVNFLSSMLFVAAFGFLYRVGTDRRFQAEWHLQRVIPKIVAFAVPAILLFSLYMAFRLELGNYWDQLFLDSRRSVETSVLQFEDTIANHELKQFKLIWIINYSLLFVSLLAFFNIKKIKNTLLGYINLALLVLMLLQFLTVGLYMISELREVYLAQTQAEYYPRGWMYIGLRYISLGFAALALWACHAYTRQDFIKPDFKMGFDLLLSAAVLWVSSSELIHWMDMAGSGQSYKLGLSILWGVYAALLIGLGIWKSRVHLRIFAIILFALTLLKLIFYDLAQLDTISKTIVFVSLGVLLLIISFLYQKYKHLLADETDA